MKMTDGMFIREARQVHEQDYPNIHYQEQIVDAAAMRLVRAGKLEKGAVEETARLALLTRGMSPIGLTKAQVCDVVDHFDVEWD